MSTAMQELNDLAENTAPEAESNIQNKTSVKDEVKEAIEDYSQEQHRKAQEIEENERQRKQQLQQQAESNELKEVSEAVITSLREEMSKDKSFEKLIQENDLPSSLIESIAEVGDPEDAPLIVKELANSEDFKNSLKRTKTQVGVKRLIGKIRKSVLTGANHQGKIPPMLKESIPSYNPNNSYSGYDEDEYSDIAMRHGI